MSLVDPNFPDNSRSYNINKPDKKLKQKEAIDILTLKDKRYIDTGTQFDDLYHAHGLFSPDDVNYFGKRYRNGILNPYQTVSRVREYLFFTKPDLNIFNQNSLGKVESDDYTVKNLFSTLQDLPFWVSLVEKHKDVIGCLQQSANINGSRENKFNHLLANTVQSNLEVPGISANSIETPINLYGVGYSYRSSSEASDDNPSFSLEFRDTRYLPVYHFFKAYEEYETLKHHGQIIPSIFYVQNKIVHDLYSVYKFLVDDDNETILYYGKYYGVASKTVPRDVFGNTTFDNGLSYTVEFSAAFYEDMNPQILAEFNVLSYNYWRDCKYDIEVFNPNTGLIDNRPAKAAIVIKEPHSTDAGSFSSIVGISEKTGANYASQDDEVMTIVNDHPTPHWRVPGLRYVYKLKWRGDDES